jgi:hypothetical protein
VPGNFFDTVLRWQANGFANGKPLRPEPRPDLHLRQYRLARIYVLFTIAALLVR